MSCGHQGKKSSPTPITPYDDVPYPSGIFLPTHPDGLATMARLHGLEPPAIEHARVLEIGGSDGINLIALAATFPEAKFVSFDLAPSAVARGQLNLRKTGLTNIRVEVGDILDWADHCEDKYDYIIAHGIYAWVPESVRDGIWRLIKRALSPNGVAFVSYNALPGGYLRLALRDMMLLECGDIKDPRSRIDKARQALQAYTAKDLPEDPFLRALHEEALKMLSRRPEVLYHDELGDFFAPQLLKQVSDAAAAHGLSYLTDAAPGLLADGFVNPDDNDPNNLPTLMAQARDFATIRYFRSSLFVHDTQPAQRQLQAETISRLYVCAPCKHISDNTFEVEGSHFAITDPRLQSIIEGLIAQFPNRSLVSSLTDNPDIHLNIFRLFDIGLLRLHSGPLPYCTTVSDYPTASYLIRAQLSEGLDRVCTLDHRIVTLDSSEPRDLILLLDGDHNLESLKAEWARMGHDKIAPIEGVLKKLAESGFLVG